MMRAARILEASLYADDLNVAHDFYTKVLGLELVSDLDGRGLAFGCGETILLVFDARRTEVPSGPIPAHGARGAGHVAFVASADELPGWREHLARHHVAIEAEVEWPSGGRSLYFRDPAGNSLELAPPDVWGPPRVGTPPTTSGPPRSA